MLAVGADSEEHVKLAERECTFLFTCQVRVGDELT